MTVPSSTSASAGSSEVLATANRHGRNDRHRIAAEWCAALLLATALIGCGSKPGVPFRPEPIAYADTLPSRQPKPLEPREVERLLEASIGGQLGHAFSLRRWLGAQHEALNITRFDDVVGSAWFEHRNGRRSMTPAEVARGPTTAGPDTSRTLMVIAGKSQGISPGFTVRDANGSTFLFKFDPKGDLHLASAAGVISSRLFYAAGYHTPEDFVVVFDSARLELDPGAELDTGFEERPMTEDDIAAVLSLTDSLPDGTYLALASKFVPGRPLGPFLFSGLREDDANDYYHHEYRRELRGLYVVSSWLNHVDMRYANTLDAFIDPPGYVRHYLIDFAATLGSGTIRSHKPREGSEYNFDLWASLGRIFTLGFYKKGWEGKRFEEYHPAIGWLPVDNFQPGAWKANWPNEAFNKRTDRDNYWGAKLVGSFSDEQIAAAVSEGCLPGQAAEILTRILIRRRDILLAYWYGKVTPLENPAVQLQLSENGPALVVSFDDLGLRAGAWSPSETRYFWRLDDPSSRSFSRGERAAGAGTRQTLRIELARSPDDRRADGGDFATLRVSARRPGASGREAVIYLRRTAESYQVVGLEH
jgi:hypothetical protein